MEAPGSSMTFRISPNFTSEKLRSPTIRDLIDIHEDRVQGWMLQPARALLYDVAHGAVASFALMLTYFESYAFYRFGTKFSQEGFKQGMQEVVDVVLDSTDRPHPDRQTILESIASLVYTDGRCGLFHAGMIRRGIVLDKIPGGPEIVLLASIHKQTGRIDHVRIDPYKLENAIRSHFQRHVAALRAGTDRALLAAFESAWKTENDPAPLNIPAGAGPEPTGTTMGIFAQGTSIAYPGS